MKSRIDHVIEAEQERTKKIADLIKLVKDPDLKDFVNKLFGESPSDVAISATTIHASSNGRVSLEKLKITPAIRLVANALPTPFTNRDVAKVLLEGHFNFRGRKPEETVRDAIYFLARGDQAIFRIVKPGKPGQMTEYERV